MSDFVSELRNLINKHGKENGSDTPDMFLAVFLDGCLTAFDTAVRHREGWYGRDAQHSCDAAVRADAWASSGDRQTGDYWVCPCGKVYQHLCDEAEGCSWRLENRMCADA